MAQDNNISEERLGELLEAVDYALSERHATTLETMAVARQLALSSVAQMAQDNPTCDASRLIDGYTRDLRQALNRRIFLPGFGTAGEA